MPKQLINIALPGSDGAEGDNLGTMFLGDSLWTSMPT
jgi:hypothetical protein